MSWPRAAVPISSKALQFLVGLAVLGCSRRSRTDVLFYFKRGAVTSRIRPVRESLWHMIRRLGEGNWLARLPRNSAFGPVHWAQAIIDQVAWYNFAIKLNIRLRSPADTNHPGVAPFVSETVRKDLYCPFCSIVSRKVDILDYFKYPSLSLICDTGTLAAQPSTPAYER
jgi:hypothetical protein